MTDDNLVIRSMHDVGLAAWFGGSLMGAIGLNGAAAAARDPQERPRLSAIGWGRWAPVNAAAIAVHLVGGAALTIDNRKRVIAHPGSRWNTAVKTGVTGLALAATAWSGWEGRQVGKEGPTHAEGATEPSAHTPHDVAKSQKRLRYVQWAIPALTGVLVVLGAQQGEQQRPGKLARDAVNRSRRRLGA